MRRDYWRENYWSEDYWRQAPVTPVTTIPVVGTVPVVPVAPITPVASFPVSSPIPVPFPIPFPVPTPFFPPDSYLSSPWVVEISPKENRRRYCCRHQKGPVSFDTGPGVRKSRRSSSLLQISFQSGSRWSAFYEEMYSLLSIRGVQ